MSNIWPPNESLGDRLAQTLELFAVHVLRALRVTPRAKGICVGNVTLDNLAGASANAWLDGNPNTTLSVQIEWKGIGINHPDHLKLTWTLTPAVETEEVEAIDSTICDADCFTPQQLAETIMHQVEDMIADLDNP